MYWVTVRCLLDLLSPICRAAFALTKPLKMNMVKRIMGRPRQEECSPQDNALGLMHLRRLFSELCHPPRHMTQKEQEEKLYMMLPVFNRVSHTMGGGRTGGAPNRRINRYLYIWQLWCGRLQFASFGSCAVCSYLSNHVFLVCAVLKKKKKENKKRALLCWVTNALELLPWGHGCNRYYRCIDIWKRDLTRELLQIQIQWLKAYFHIFIRTCLDSSQILFHQTADKWNGNELVYFCGLIDFRAKG